MTPANRTAHPTTTPEVFDTAFPARTDAVGTARRAFADWLRRRTRGDVVIEMEIVFSELAANAVDASPRENDEIRGRAWCDGPDLIMDLTNRADATSAQVPRWDLDDPLRTGGRGLVITEAFVDSVEVALEPGQRLVVRCRRRID
jgi:anti-sigma regulatory factor (Ser/Thr protein kinase)